MDKQHQLIHGIKATGCDREWSDMPGQGRSRYCGQCQLRVVDLENLNDSDMEAFLYSQGHKPGISLCRRNDGKFVVGECRRANGPNLPASVGFILTPLIPFAFCHPHVALTPTLFTGSGMVIGWLLLGAFLVSRTRSTTLGGVIFAIFVLPALIGAMTLL